MKRYIVSHVCLLLLFLCGTLGTHALVTDATRASGRWVGKLEFMGREMPVVIVITTDETGALSAALSSPAQGTQGIPVDNVQVQGDTLDFTIAAAGVRYSGRLSSAGDSIIGSWIQAGMTLPLNFGRARSENDNGLQRPQEPQGTPPYRVEEVRFRNDSAAIELAATFTLPPGAGPFPAVVLISGSGAQDRDESIAGHRPFWVLADYLTRKGIAVLRYDERGVGGSEGNFAKADSRDLAGDVAAALRFLQAETRVQQDALGLIGHSEGGYIAAMLAAESAAVDFIVLLAAPGLPGAELLILQSAALMRAAGNSAEEIARAQERQRAMFAIVTEGQGTDSIRARLRMLLSEGQSFPEGSPARKQLDAQVEQLAGPWFRFFLAYDPREALRRVQCPVLALNGAKDLQVPPTENLAAIRRALQEAGNTDCSFEVLPDINHLFQTCESGAVEEYGRIEESFAPVALARIADWINQQSGSKAGRK